MCVFAACCHFQHAALLFFGFQLKATWERGPLSLHTRLHLQLSVQSVPLPVVAVERSVAVLHVAIFRFFSPLLNVVFIFRLRLLFIAPLILNNVLTGKRRHKISAIACLRWLCYMLGKYKKKHLKWEFIHFLEGIWWPCAKWGRPRRCAESAAQTSARWRSRSPRRGGRGSGGTPMWYVWSWTTGQKQNRESSQSHLQSPSKAHWEPPGM